MNRGLDWLSGGGEMGKLIRSMDWAQTPLGPVDAWPQSLRTTVSLCLSSTFPILIAWGPERVQIYNDSYRPICGEKHPLSMGQPFNECWASALPAVGAILDRAQSGEGSYLENLRMFLDRYGYLEEAFMTFSFSPIRDESGGVGGLFHPITEVTEKMLSARRTQALRELATALGDAKSSAEIGERLVQAHAALALDLPFLLFYEFDSSAGSARLVRQVGLAADSRACPAEIPTHLEPATSWPLARVLRVTTQHELDDLTQRFGALVCAPYPEPVQTALLIPVQPAGTTAPLGCLVAGVSARRALDPSYRAFYEMLGSTVTTALSNVRAYEQEQQRAEALAEIDRAKTAFFSNVSHEFRTPLTLMLGPLEDGLSDVQDALSPGQRERQLLIQKSALRLLKLVNTLLDFSRIEAGRMQASYEATDLATLTRDLASAFRSAIEKAGLTLTVDCPVLPEPVWVDHELWEKVVLNLVSNAFKHTFVGEIAVRLRHVADHVELAVSDTGTGIPSAELPRIFDRFHRVQGARGRSFEGSGIGLSLVQELVKLHGGSVQVASQLERGSTFTVRLPTGSAHLPEERLNAGRSMVSTATRADAFVHEASNWLADGQVVQVLETLPPLPRADEDPVRAPARILLADDNADMRDYVRRLLEPRYEVETVADGGAALAAVSGWQPDLVLSDVMMPNLDGFGLIAALQADPKTASLPVILLSARAGEESTLEGLRAGATDYLVKPFSARELIARVEGALRIARARLETRAEQSRLEAVLAALHDGVIFQDAAGIARYCNAASERLLGVSLAQLAGRTSMDPRWGAVWEDGSSAPGELHAPMVALRTAQPVVDQVLGIRRPDQDIIWLRVNAQPIFELNGTLAGVVSSFSDLTEERRRAEFSQQLLGIVSHDLRNPLNAVILGTENLRLFVRQGDADFAARATGAIARIQSSADRALRLVRDLLDFTQARIGSGIPVEREPMDFGLCVRQALDEIRSAYPGRAVELSAHGELTAAGDADRLAQVVHNLVTNALKYGEPSAPAKVTLQGDVDTILLTVHNYGEPIELELLPKIFKPLVRGGGELERRSRSIGLGLFIVQQLVAAHGGTVSVISTREAGTTFSVRLPRA